MQTMTGLQRAMRRSIRGLALALFGAALLLPASPASTAGTQQEDVWQYTGALYLWAAGIGGNSASGGAIDVGFDKLLDNLDMAFMGAVEARKGKWSILADVIYLSVSQENSGVVNLPTGSHNIELATSSTVAVKSWVVMPSIGYTLVDTTQGTLDAVAGARFLYLKAGLDAQVVGPVETRSASVSDSGNVWDGIVGVRGRVNLAERWYLPYYADIGAGDSKLTWQAFGGVGYRFGNFDAMLGYRYLAWDFRHNAVLDDMNLGGPYLGIKFRF